MMQDDEFFDYDIMEILIGQIKNDFKVGDIFDTGTVQIIDGKPNIDKLKKLISFMKNRLFPNFRQIFPLLYDKS